MVTALDNFLHSFAKDLVARAAAATPSVTIVYQRTPPAKADLWRGRAVEAESLDPYSVLAITGGPPQGFDALVRRSVQIWTVGSTIEGALNRAQTLYEAMLDTDGRPVRMRTITGYLAANNTSDGHWLIVSIDPLQAPGHVGTDVNRKEQVSFNVDLGFVKKD